MSNKRQINEVPYTAQQMYDLVADIERYPEFVPYCTGLRILKKEKNPQGEPILHAEMLVSYKVFRERFKCKVTFEPKALKIMVQYIEGPIKKLDNVWTFRSIEKDHSEIDFEIDFEFSNFLLQQMSTAVFDKVFLRMSDAFIKRAHQIYATPA